MKIEMCTEDEDDRETTNMLRKEKEVDGRETANMLWKEKDVDGKETANMLNTEKGVDLRKTANMLRKEKEVDGRETANMLWKEKDVDGKETANMLNTEKGVDLRKTANMLRKEKEVDGRETANMLRKEKDVDGKETANMLYTEKDVDGSETANMLNTEKGVDLRKTANMLRKEKDEDFSTEIDDRQEETSQLDISERREHDGVPRDRGWAWFVLLGATLEMLLQLGIIKSTGILFVAFQEKFYSSSSMTSLLSTVQNICQSLTAFLVMTCGIKLTTYRNLMFLGSIITCSAYIITSQATDIRVLLFSHGVLQGIGSGTMLPTTITMVSLYFEKRRGLANSIAVSGGPVGGVIFAFLITKLLSAYGYQGCVLILAGILLNGCVSGALFRSTSFYTESINKHRIEGKGNNCQKLITSFDKKNDQDIHSYFEQLDMIAAKKHMALHEQNNISASVTRIEKLHKTSTDSSKWKCDSTRQRSYSANDLAQKRVTETVYRRTEKSYPSISVKLSMEDIVQQAKLYEKEHDTMSGGRFAEVKLILCQLAESFNFKILSNLVFVAFLIQGSLISTGTIVAQVFIVPYARDMKISPEDIATLVTTQSCIDFFSRIIIGYISDKGWFRRSAIVATASLIVSVSSSLIGFYTTYSSLLGYSVVLGLVSGVYFSLYTVVLIDYLTLANFQTCYGFMSLVHGFSIAGGFYLVGYLRDISDSYVFPNQILGAATGVGAIIMFLLPVIQRLQKM